MKKLFYSIFVAPFEKEKLPYDPQNGFEGKLPLKLKSTTVPNNYPTFSLNLKDRSYFSKNIVNA